MFQLGNQKKNQTDSKEWAVSNLILGGKTKRTIIYLDQERRNVLKKSFQIIFYLCLNIIIRKYWDKQKAVLYLNWLRPIISPTAVVWILLLTQFLCGNLPDALEHLVNYSKCQVSLAFVHANVLFMQVWVSNNDEACQNSPKTRCCLQANLQTKSKLKHFLNLVIENIMFPQILQEDTKVEQIIWTNNVSVAVCVCVCFFPT